MKIVAEKHVAYRKKPINLNDTDSHLFAHELERCINETHIVSLKNIYVVDELLLQPKSLRIYSSYIYPPLDGTSLRPLLHNVFHCSTRLLKLLSMILQKTEYIEHAVWITDRRSWSYFHWLTDALPRLMACKNFISDHAIALPVFYEKFPYVKESIKLLNIPVVFYNSSKKIKVKDLIVSNHTALPGNYNKELIKLVRENFLRAYKGTVPTRKVYISRQKAQKRKISNEKDVINLLSEHGFETHYFEDYPFEKQIMICAQSRSLVGLHGAGLTNILFMPENGQLLELRNENDSHNNCYFALASDLNIQYYYQISKGDRSETHTVNVSVNLTELERNLELMETQHQTTKSSPQAHR